MKGNTAILGILRNVDRTIESPASDDPRKKRLTYYAALSIPLLKLVLFKPHINDPKVIVGVRCHSPSIALRVFSKR